VEQVDEPARLFREDKQVAADDADDRRWATSSRSCFFASISVIRGSDSLFSWFAFLPLFRGFFKGTTEPILAPTPRLALAPIPNSELLLH
jgi:hypothetical protein